MTAILTNYELFDKDVLSLIKDYMGQNKYQLNYKICIEEYKKRINNDLFDEQFIYIPDNLGYRLTGRLFVKSLYMKFYMHNTGSLGKYK